MRALRTWLLGLSVLAAQPSHYANAQSLCENTCRWPSDTECDDGGPGAEYSGCTFGSDCVDW